MRQKSRRFQNPESVPPIGVYFPETQMKSEFQFFSTKQCVITVSVWDTILSFTQSGANFPIRSHRIKITAKFMALRTKVAKLQNELSVEKRTYCDNLFLIDLLLISSQLQEDMRKNSVFQDQILECVFGGVSALNISRLDIHDLKQAHEFVKAYGYDLSRTEDQNRAWEIHQRAITFMTEKILGPGEEIPLALVQREQLKDIGYLLVYASTQQHENNSIQKWSCALLRVMHVIVHLSHDLFSFFVDEIQNQVFSPIQEYISKDPVMGTILGTGSSREIIKLHRFEMKTLKSTNSSIIKMLAKPSALAFTLFDKLGVRFVTHNIFDSFRVVRFLVDHHLISFPNIVPQQSNNSLYPLDLFFEVLDEIQGQILENDQINALLMKRLDQLNQADLSEKVNDFSGENYRFLKFISRQLIRVDHAKDLARVNQRDFSFFYPYEVQIMDFNTYLTTISGPEAHDQYKERQRKAARLRVLGSQ